MQGAVYWVITGSLIADALAYSAFLLLYNFTCWPRVKIWNFELPGKCVDWNRLNMAMGILNTLSDVEAFLVPIWCIWRLHVGIKKKFEAIAVFAAGGLAVAIGCLGMTFRIISFYGHDHHWLLTQLSIICMAELSIFLIVGCCPAVARIVRRHRPESKSTMVNSYGKSQMQSSSQLEKALHFKGVTAGRPC